MPLIREIPSYLTDGIQNGTYTVHGGVVRDLGGRIVAHLQIGSDVLRNGRLVLNELPQCFNALQQATICLQGVNLAVNIVGFAIVCQKLNKVNEELYRVSDKLDILIGEQQRSEIKRERNEFSKFKADLDNLETNLRNERIAGIDDARNSLNRFVQSQVDDLHVSLQDLRQVYRSIEAVNCLATTAMFGDIAIAHSYALENKFDEGFNRIKRLETWHTKYRNKLEQPLQELPLWLSQLDSKQIKDCQTVVREQRALPDGFAYMRENIKLCQEHSLTMADLNNMVGNEDMVMISFA